MLTPKRDELLKFLAIDNTISLEQVESNSEEDEK